MNKIESRGRKKKRDDSDIPSIIDDLSDKAKREILERWIKEQRDKKDKKEMKSYKQLSVSMMSRISGIHRTTFYKKNKRDRKYKFAFARKVVQEVFLENRKIYGSRRLSIVLEQKGIKISDRSLRNYMNRWELICKVRKARRKSESKNTNSKIQDLVCRNFNPYYDEIVASDVSYIPAKSEQNFIYLSVVISHKTKLIEAWELSSINNTKLVINTIKKLKRIKPFIFHTDHGSQYSTDWTLNELSKINGVSSMGRVANTHDNREVEYFFGCLKGEHLNHLPTHRMTIDEIRKEISWYINWYNNNRIQSRLQWKTPASASAYAI